MARATPSEDPPRPLHVRWLGRVRYRDAHALQHGLFDQGDHDHLLLLEHPHVYTLGVRADPAGWRHGRAEATPVSLIVHNAGFTTAFAQCAPTLPPIRLTG